MKKITRGQSVNEVEGDFLPLFVPVFQWKKGQYRVNVLYITGMETYVFHMLPKQRKVPGNIVGSICSTGCGI